MNLEEIFVYFTNGVKSLQLGFFLPFAPETDTHCRGSRFCYFCYTQLILMFQGDGYYKE